MRHAEKVKTKFYSCIPFILDPGKKIPKKNRKKNQKIKKPIYGIIFSQNGMRLADKERKKNLLPNSIPTQPELENSK